MILRKGVIVETVNDKTQTREMTEDEIKGMLGHLRFNTGMSLPDQLIHDFMSESRILPTFKKCMHFNRDDFNKMVQPLKHKKKPRPRRKTKVKAKSNVKAKAKAETKTKGEKTRKRR
uniref:Uncharacterized protein n=1 Tax=viral metagenome TaxID=1070528 RepID=A0A6C0HNK9_9ZZZZ